MLANVLTYVNKYNLIVECCQNVILKQCCFTLKQAYYGLQHMVHYAVTTTQVFHSEHIHFMCVGLVQEGSEFPQSHWLRLDQYWWRDGDAKCGAQ